jgi:hypothetical protein
LDHLTIECIIGTAVVNLKHEPNVLLFGLNLRGGACGGGQCAAQTQQLRGKEKTNSERRDRSDEQ